MAYFLTTDFNGIDLLKDNRAFAKCQTCGQPLRKYLEKVDTKKQATSDISRSRDGFLIVSKRFKRFYEVSCFRGCDFVHLSSGDYIMTPKRCVDLEFSPVVLSRSESCKICGQFTKFLAATHEAKIAADQIAVSKDEFVRSRQETPMIIGCDFHLLVGEVVAATLAQSKMKRIVLKQI